MSNEMIGTSLTKLRLQKINLGRNGGLKKDLIKRCFVKNIDWYIKNVRKRHFSTKVSGPMRNEILEEILKPRSIDHEQKKREFDRMMRSIVYLLSSWTKEINLDTLLIFCPERLVEATFPKVLRYIARGAPNLENLTAQTLPAVMCYKVKKNLIKMKQLRHITLKGCILHWQDFVELCKNLPHLKELRIARFHDSANTLRLLELRRGLNDIATLRTLHCKTIQSLILEVLERNLPNLSLVFKGPLQNAAFLCDSDNNITANVREILYRPLYSHFAREISLKFPNVTVYQVDCHGAEYKDCLPDHLPDFPKLEQLQFEGLKRPEIFYRVLLRYGGNLQELVVRGDGEPRLSLQRIFDLCPKLQYLTLRRVCVVDNSEPINFLKLKELSLIKISCENQSNILLAPNLIKVTLNAKYSDLVNLCHVLPASHSKIESFIMHLRDLVLTSKEEFENISQFWKVLSVLSPRLTFCQFFIGVWKTEYCSHVRLCRYICGEVRGMLYYTDPSLVDVLQAYD